MTADNVLFEIKGLKKNFGDLEVLKGIHTTIRKGEDRKSTRLNSSHWNKSRMPSSA